MIPTMSLPQASKRLQKNVWADYIELLCLTNEDNEVSLSDLAETARLEDPDGPTRGAEGAGEDEDRYYLEFLDFFKYLRMRSKILGEYYPFQFVDEDTITLCQDSITTQQKLYLFLLYASNLSQFAKNDRPRLTRNFEALSKDILSLVYPGFLVEIFGTASNPEDLFHGGKIIDRLEKLADSLHVELTKAARENEHYLSPGGDAGLDIIGFAQLEDVTASSPFLPMFLAQCTCSVDEWKEKQHSIKYDEWITKLSPPPAHYSEYILVPFSLRGPNGKWASTELDQIVSIPIDRIRFLHIIKNHGNDLGFFEKSDAYTIMQESLFQ